MNEVELISKLARCQGLLEGIYLGLSYNDFNLIGVKNSLNEATALLQDCRDRLNEDRQTDL